MGGGLDIYLLFTIYNHDVSEVEAFVNKLSNMATATIKT